MVILYLFSLFFNVNDSIITFKKSFSLRSKTESTITLWYPHKIEEFEAGNYFYPSFTIGEINVLRKRKGAIIKIHFKSGKTPFIYGHTVILRPPEKRFYIKTYHASSEDLKRLFKFMGYKFNWLDSLNDGDYTIWGMFTENKLKWILMKNGRKNTKTIKKR